MNDVRDHLSPHSQDFSLDVNCNKHAVLRNEFLDGSYDSWLLPTVVESDGDNASRRFINNVNGLAWNEEFRRLTQFVMST
jgi:glycerol kinase